MKQGPEKYGNGKRVWKSYETLFVDGEDFEQIGEAFEAVYPVKKVTLGNGTIRFMKQRDIVDFARGDFFLDKN